MLARHGRFASLVATYLTLASGCDAVTREAELADRDAVMAARASTEAGAKNRQVCGSGTYVHGIDVSKWQATIDWTKVAAAGVGYVFIRSSYGKTGIDDRFDANWSGARSSGLLRGAYHYFNPAYDGASQAANMLAQFADPNDLGELPIVLDVEERDATIPPATYATRVAEFLDAIDAATGHSVMIYSGGSMWDTYVKSTAFADLPIWVAHYFNDRSTAHCPNTPDAWAHWTIWQHSEMGTVDGISGAVDLDVFDGTETDLLAFSFHRADITTRTFPGPGEGHLLIVEGTCQTVSVTLDNTGGVAWGETVGLDVAAGLDVTGIASGSWPRPTRVAAVPSVVDVGDSVTLAFELCGNTIGEHPVALEVVDAGVVAFSAALQGGPTATDLSFVVEVVPAGTPIDPPAPIDPPPPTDEMPPLDRGRGCTAAVQTDTDRSSRAAGAVFAAVAMLSLARRGRRRRGGRE